jgi:hypothetical protein
MRRTKRFLLLAVAVISFTTASSSVAPAASYYMAPNGSDSNTGAIFSPWKTVGFASGKLKAGDTLYARGGTYTGQLGVSWNSPSGTASAPITWKGYPGETPIFDGQGADSGFLAVNGTDWFIIEGITIQNYYGCCAAIWIGGSSSNYAENNIIRNNTILNQGTVTSNQSHGIYCSWHNRNLEISGNAILRTKGGAGIHCYHDPGLENGKIYNNVIDGNNTANWGIVLRYTKDIEVSNNTVINTTPYPSQGSDIDYWGSTGITIRNNILSLPTYGNGSATCSHNLFVRDAKGGNTLPNCGTNNLTAASAGFVNALGGDYHLESTSPAIDKGTTISSVTQDKDGIPRPQGNGYDIGAFEFQTNGGVPTLHRHRFPLD